MPCGTRHELDGLLLRDQHVISLRADDGGEWRLDEPLRAERLIGQRVHVTGVRDGFDLLAVGTVCRWRADGEYRRPNADGSLLDRCFATLFPYRSRHDGGEL